MAQCYLPGEGGPGPRGVRGREPSPGMGSRSLAGCLGGGTPANVRQRQAATVAQPLLLFTRQWARLVSSATHSLPTWLAWGGRVPYRDLTLGPADASPALRLLPGSVPPVSIPWMVTPGAPTAARKRRQGVPRAHAGRVWGSWLVGHGSGHQESALPAMNRRKTPG